MNHTQNTYIASLLGYDGTEDEDEQQPTITCDLCDAEYDADAGGQRVMRVGCEETPRLHHYCPECKAEVDAEINADTPTPMTEQCDFCDFPAVHTDGVTHLCESCQAELDESNAAFQPKPTTRINWKQFFGVEDETASLNTFYSGVEA